MKLVLNRDQISKSANWAGAMLILWHALLTNVWIASGLVTQGVEVLFHIVDPVSIGSIQHILQIFKRSEEKKAYPTAVLPLVDP